MLQIKNFNIKEGKMKEFQQFIKDNEATQAAHAPKGWKDHSWEDNHTGQAGGLQDKSTQNGHQKYCRGSRGNNPG